MKILIITNLFPPFVMGGAEMAAYSLAGWLVSRGHEVRVLTSAPAPADAGTEILADGLRVERRHFANRYQVYKAPPAPPLTRLDWHRIDHFHPTTEEICGEVMDDFQPDIVNCHDLQGIGYNLLKAIGDRGLPCVETLHDFGFICLSMNMFREGHECPRHHLPCVLSTVIKRSYFHRIKTLAFISPTAALLERYRPHLPGHAESHVIKHPLRFAPPGAGAERRADCVVELLYVGQLEPWKGVDFLISTLEELAGAFRFRLTVVGGGSLLESLQARGHKLDWLTVTGKVPPENVGGYMGRSDLLVVPSLWFENAPVVISQAVALGLPILASNTGGIPEMVQAGVNGELLPHGDQPAWKAMLARVFQAPEPLASWREGASGLRESASADRLGERILEVFRRTSERRRERESTTAALPRP